MKTLLSSSMAVCTTALLLAGCQKGMEVETLLETKGREISFHVQGGLATPTTKAATIHQRHLASFTISGAWKPVQSEQPETRTATLNEVWGLSDHMLFDATPVIKNSNSNWDYNPKQNWPMNGAIDFFAYSPEYSPNIIADGTHFSSCPEGNPEGPKLKYRVPQASDVGEVSQEDLLVAVAPNQSEATAAGSVRLNFKHALSRVLFSAYSVTGVPLEVKRIQLLNLHSTGTLRFVKTNTDNGTEEYQIPYNSGSFDYTTSQQVLWEPTETLENYSPDFVGGILVNSNPVMLTTRNQGLFVLPQVTEAGQYNKKPMSSQPADNQFCVYVEYLSNGRAYKEYIPVINTVDKIDEPFIFEIGREYNFQLALGSAFFGSNIQIETGVQGFDSSYNNEGGLVKAPNNVNSQSNDTSTEGDHINLNSSEMPTISGVTYNNESKQYEISDNANLILTGTATDKKIKITGKGVELTLKDVHTSLSEGNQHGIELADQAEVIITLEGTNTISANGQGAGIYVPTGTKLTLKGDGTLVVTGGTGGAGIGTTTNENDHAGVITFENANVYAKGGYNVAGIGTTSSNGCGAITIEDSKVAAASASGPTALAIGSAAIYYGADNGNISIQGQSVVVAAGVIKHGEQGFERADVQSTVIAYTVQGWWSSDENKYWQGGTPLAGTVSFDIDKTTINLSGLSSTPNLVTLPVSWKFKP